MTITDNQEFISIPLSEYNQLNDDQFRLNCLRNAGVDNWEGYEFAMEEYRSNTDTED